MRGFVLLVLALLSTAACRPETRTASQSNAQAQTADTGPEADGTEGDAPDPPAEERSAEFQLLTSSIGPAANQLIPTEHGVAIVVSVGFDDSTAPELIWMNRTLDTIQERWKLQKGSNPMFGTHDDQNLFLTAFGSNEVVRRPLQLGSETSWTAVTGLRPKEGKAENPSGIARAGDYLVTSFVNMKYAGTELEFGRRIAVTDLNEAETSWIDSPVPDPQFVLALDETHVAVAMGRLKAGNTLVNEGKVGILELEPTIRWLRTVDVGGFPARSALDRVRKSLLVCDSSNRSQWFVIPLEEGSFQTISFKDAKEASCSDIAMSESAVFVAEGNAANLWVWKGLNTDPACVLPIPSVGNAPSRPVDLEVLNDTLLILASNGESISSLWKLELNPEGLPSGCGE